MANIMARWAYKYLAVIHVTARQKITDISMNHGRSVFLDKNKMRQNPKETYQDTWLPVGGQKTLSLLHILGRGAHMLSYSVRVPYVVGNCPPPSPWITSLVTGNWCCHTKGLTVVVILSSQDSWCANLLAGLVFEWLSGLWSTHWGDTVWV